MPERLAHPVRVGPDGRLAVVEQDSDSDVRQCIRLLLAHQPGDYPANREVGFPEQTFAENVDARSVLDGLERWEPRAPFHADVVSQELAGAGLASIDVAYFYDEPNLEDQPGG